MIGFAFLAGLFGKLGHLMINAVEQFGDKIDRSHRAHPWLKFGEHRLSEDELFLKERLAKKKLKGQCR